MKMRLMLAAWMLAGLAVGCGGPVAEATPTPKPTDTVVAVTPTAGVAPSTPQSSGPAQCVLEPMVFEPNPNVPPISEDDHTVGPVDAPIQFIEYAEFQ